MNPPLRHKSCTDTELLDSDFETRATYKRMKHPSDIQEGAGTARSVVNRLPEGETVVGPEDH